MIKNTIFIVLALALVAGVVGFLLIGRSVVDVSLPKEGRKIQSDLAFTDYEGRSVKLSDFAGRPLVLNAWAVWCPFCREELADFAILQQEFGEKIVIVAIDRAETLEVAKKYSDELGVTDKMIFLLDPGDSFYKSIGGFSMPETVFVDRDGFVRDHKRGPMKLEEMRRRTQQAFGL